MDVSVMVEALGVKNEAMMLRLKPVLRTQGMRKVGYWPSFAVFIIQITILIFRFLVITEKNKEDLHNKNSMKNKNNHNQRSPS